jgi:predicted carbohydrate-binding protein with CBM5 and CBM33 domain
MLLASLVPSRAAAHSSGIVGYSGKQGTICTNCHSGGDEPDVKLTGPAALAPGTSGTYVFTIHATVSRQAGAGFNVAASAGSLATAGTNQQRILDELTHKRPETVTAATRDATWTFKWTAPAAPGTYTLYAAGNSVNDNDTQSGDNARATTLPVTVGDVPVPTTTPTRTPPPANTPTPTATPTETPPATATGDANCDGVVSAADVSAAVAAFGTAPTTCAGVDVTGDGAIDADDAGKIVALLFQDASAE